MAVAENKEIFVKQSSCGQPKVPTMQLGHAVVQLVEALRYKLEVRGIDS
jgi:hypothetical protein